jgi:hypothetical protein
VCVVFEGEEAVAGVDVLRARKRSSERTAMAFMRRTETGGCERLVVGRGWRVGGRCGGTLEETAEGEEEGGHFVGGIGCWVRECSDRNVCTRAVVVCTGNRFFDVVRRGVVPTLRTARNNVQSPRCGQRPPKPEPTSARLFELQPYALCINVFGASLRRSCFAVSSLAEPMDT